MTHEEKTGSIWEGWTVRVSGEVLQLFDREDLANIWAEVKRSAGYSVSVDKAVMVKAAPAAPETQRVDVLRDGEPCEHAGCLRHVSHPCEGCGRIAGRAARPALDVEGLAKAFEYVLQMRSHLCDDPELPKVARDLAETAVEFMSKNGGRNA